MALSGLAKTSHDGGTIVFTDGTGTPLSLTVRWDAADFNVSGLNDALREVVTITGRGKTRSKRYGAPKFPTFSFTVQVTDLSETGTGTIADWIMRTTGTPFASRVSTATDFTEIKVFHVTFTQEGTTYGDAADQTIKLEDCYVTEWGFAEGEPNTISVSGEVWGDVYLNATKVADAPRG